MINPRKYIDYNLKTEPYNTNFFKSFNAQIKLINNKEYICEKILDRTNKNIKYNDNFFNLSVKKNKEDIFNKDLKDLKEIKTVFLYNDKNILKLKNHDKNIIINSQFKEKNKKKNLLQNRVIKNLSKIKRYKLFNFDEEMNDVMLSTKNTVKYLNDLSEKNSNLINNIKNIYERSMKFQ